MSAKMNKNGIGQTNLQKDTQNLRQMLKDSHNGQQLQEKSLLLEFYYKDQQKCRANTQYLRKANPNSQHRRISSRRASTEKLFALHNQDKLKAQKLRVFLREDKVVEEAFTSAKRNYSYRRQKNYHQLEYIIEQNFNNLIATMSLTENEQQLSKFSLQMRLFLNFAEVSQSARVYYDHIQPTSFERLFKFCLSANSKIKLTKLYALAENIMLYKKEKVMNLQDFREWISQIEAIYAFNLVQSLYQVHRQLFRLKEQDFQGQNIKSISQYMSSKKYDFMLNKIFNCQPKKLIGQKLLPIRIILRLLRAWGVSEKQLLSSVLVYYLKWQQSNKQGLTFAEFYKAFIMIFMSKGGIRAIRDFFSSLSSQLPY